MTIIARIEVKPFGWAVTLLFDQANSIAFNAATLAVYHGDYSGKFEMHADGVDGAHLDAKVDIIIGPEDIDNYGMLAGAVE